eukprot:UN03031
MFGWEPPQFAHLPLLLREDGGKLSKRFRDSSLDYYVEQGYLPEALVNFVALLGWHPTLEEMQEHARAHGADIQVPSKLTSEKVDVSLKNNVDLTQLDPAKLKAMLTDR